MSEESIKMEERLKKVYTDPLVQKAIVEKVVTDKPSGWSSRSTSSYYKEAYALRIKKTVDEMMADGQPVIYDYALYQSKYNLSKDSLYLMINHSLRYLKDKLDPDRKYAKFLETVKTERDRERGGIIMSVRAGLSDEDFLTPRKIEHSPDTPQWRDEMDAWLEAAEPGCKPFHKKGLALTTNEILQLEQELAGLPDVFRSITSQSIKLVKVDAAV